MLNNLFFVFSMLILPKKTFLQVKLSAYVLVKSGKILKNQRASIFHNFMWSILTYHKL
jgi:hypothetical protein